MLDFALVSIVMPVQIGAPIAQRHVGETATSTAHDHHPFG